MAIARSVANGFSSLVGRSVVSDRSDERRRRDPACNHDQEVGEPPSYPRSCVGRRGLGAVNPMQQLIRAFVASLIASLVLGVLSAQAAAHPRQSKLPGDYLEWSRAAKCEEGRTWHGRQVIWWVGSGTTKVGYPDPLGINATNWERFGGGPAETYGPATQTEIVHAIHVGDRLIKHYGVGIPDQGGCAAW